MRFESMKRRLSKLEKRSGVRDVLLSFPDGSSRCLKIRDPLSCLLTSWEKEAAELEGRPSEPSKYDPVLHLFQNATAVEGGPLFELILGSAHHLRDNRTWTASRGKPKWF